MVLLRFFLVCIMTLFVNSSLLAMDLKAVLTIAYDNNDTLKIIRRDFLTDIEQFPQALSSFLPDIGAISTGAIATASNAKSKSQYKGSASDQDELDTAIVLAQPIFRGGGSVAGLKAAQAAFGVARGKYYAGEQQAFLTIIQSYLDYIEAQENYTISEVSLQSNKKQLEAITEKVKVGEATEIDLATAKSALAIAETNKLNAYAKVQSTKASFARQVGIEPVDFIAPEIPNSLPKTFDELLAKSIQENPSIHQVRNNVTVSQAGEVVAKSVLLPQVDFKVQGGKIHRSDNKTGLGSTNNSVSSSLSVKIPIYSKGGTTYSNIRTAKNATRKAVYQLDDQLKQNRANCITSWEGFNAAKSRIIAATQGVEAAQIAYDGMVEEEKVGSKSILDVLNAQDRLNQAKIAKVTANKEHTLAAYQMQGLIGKLTAKGMKLKVVYFEPEKEFKKIKTKIIGF